MQHDWYYSPSTNTAYHREDNKFSQFRDDAYRGDGTYARISEPVTSLPSDVLPAETSLYILDNVRLHRRPRHFTAPAPSIDDFATFRDYVLQQPTWKQRLIGTIDLRDENIALIALHIRSGRIKIVSDAEEWAVGG